ncbi:unnamed protein product [Ixodes hexagonus]
MMSKKKEAAVASSREDAPIDVIGLTSHKRHKKHKHKKHKRKRGTDQDEDQSPPASPQSGGEGTSKPSLKLKIKIGGQTVEKNVTKVKQQRPPPPPAPPDPSEADLAELLMKPDDSSADSDDEEEAWLEALESGRLEEVDDELRKMKDPTLMTARQRALLESKSQKDDVPATELAAAAAEPVKEMSEEMIQRRMLRAKKRKQQAEEKKEKEKKQTIERLLKKSDSRLRASKKLAKKSDAPKVSLVNTQAGTLLSFPVGVPFPLSPAVARGYPEKTTCGIKGCRNPKKYSCSKTGVPLCSLECYKTNMLQMCV